MNTRASTNLLEQLHCYDLFERAEARRWKVSDLPWTSFDPSLVTSELVRAVEIAAAGELTTFSATRAFMFQFGDDVDFTQWLAVWFYEETKHPLVLLKWLSLVGKTFNTDFVERHRKILPMSPSKTEMLSLNLASEITASAMYRHLSRISNEPLLAEIAKNLARDEMRHSEGFERYLISHIQTANDPEHEQLMSIRTVAVHLRRGASVNAAHPVSLAAKSANLVSLMVDNAIAEEEIATRICRLTGVPSVSAVDLMNTYLSRSAQRRRKLA